MALTRTRTSPLRGAGSGAVSSASAAGPPYSAATQRWHAMAAATQRRTTGGGGGARAAVRRVPARSQRAGASEVSRGNDAAGGLPRGGEHDTKRCVPFHVAVQRIQPSHSRKICGCREPRPFPAAARCRRPGVHRTQLRLYVNRRCGEPRAAACQQPAQHCQKGVVSPSVASLSPLQRAAGGPRRRAGSRDDQQRRHALPRTTNTAREGAAAPHRRL